MSTDPNPFSLHGAAGNSQSPQPSDDSNPYSLANIRRAPGAAPSQEQDNPFLMSNIQAGQDAGLRSGLRAAVRVNPDDAGEAYRLAKRYQAPMDLVLRNLREFQRQGKVDEANDLLARSPALAEHLRTNPQAAQMAHDDLPSLAQIESSVAQVSAASAGQAVLGMAESIWRTPDALQRAFGYVAGQVERTGLPRNLNPLRGAQDLVRLLSEGRLPTGTKFTAGTTDVADRVNAAQQLLATDTEVFGSTFKDVQTLGQNADKALATALKTGDLRQAGQVLADPTYWSAFLAQAAPSLYTAMKSGGSVAFMGWLEGMEQASSAADFERRTGLRISDADFTQAVAQSAVVNALLERYGLDKVLGAQGKGLRGVVRAVFAEGGTEALQQVNSNLAAVLTYNPAQSLSEGVLSSFMGGAGSGGAVAAAKVSVERMQSLVSARANQVNQVEQFTSQLQAQLEAAGQSKLRARDPEAFRQLMHDVAGGTIYVDAAVLNQLPPEVLQTLPDSVRQQVAPAAEAGGVVEIQVADAVAAAPGTPLAAVLLQHARPDPWSVSPAEAEAASQQSGAWLSDQASQVLAQAADEEAARASADAVRANLREQITSTGRYRPAVADGMASWIGAFYSTYAERTGLSPEQLYAAYPLKIAGEPGQADTTLGTAVAQTSDPVGPAQQVRGSFNPRALEIVLSPTADLTTLFHEGGHFFLSVLGDIAAKPNVPAGIAQDMGTLLRWFGVDSLQSWQAMPLDEQRKHHERFAESMEQYLMEGKAPSAELAPLMRRFRGWLLSVYRSIKQFLASRSAAEQLPLNDEVRKVMDRLLATDEQIRHAEQIAGMLPDEDASSAAIDALQRRSIGDLRWTVAARDKAIRRLQAEARAARTFIEAQVRAEVELLPEVRAKAALDAIRKANKGVPTEIEIATISDSFPEASWASKPQAMLEALAAFGSKRDVINAMTEQRMLEQHGDLVDPRSVLEAANEAVHNEARARALATELRAQAEMLGQRRDTGATNSAGASVTVNVLAEAAKQFGARVASGTLVRDLKSRAWSHTAAERRAAQRWQDATKAGKTVEAVNAKRDQLLSNAAARALIEARAEAEEAMAFFAKVARGTGKALVERGRDPDIVNAARAVLAAYGVETSTTKSANDYLEVLRRQDPDTWAVLGQQVAVAMEGAQPMGSLSFSELQGLRETIEALWLMARESRTMEVDGDKIDLDEAVDQIHARLVQIGVPDSIPGERSAVTEREGLVRSLVEARGGLTRIEQWAEGMDGKHGGPLLRLIQRPISVAATKLRRQRAEVLAKLQRATEQVAPFIKVGTISAPELGYTFGRGGGHNGTGMAELLPALLNIGNESNKRKLLLGRGWAHQLDDGTLDTRRWDAFINRLHNEGTLTKAHWDYVQAWWDVLEGLKPGAQSAHRRVFGRYFSEITAQAVETPYGTYRGGYYPAQVDLDMVPDQQIRKLAEAENESMAYSFPSVNKGFTMERVEYNRPLKLDINVGFKHVDKVLLFTEMQPIANGVNRLLRDKRVMGPLSRIQPGVYESLLVPWLNDAARQIVEHPVQGDGGFNKAMSILRSRTGLQIMTANLVNALQQVTGISTALAKLEADGMSRVALLKAAAKWVAGPRTLRATVWGKSDYMRDRGTNEAAAMLGTMHDILFNPTLLQRGEAWAHRHGYFMQTMADNLLSPVIWSAAYSAHLNQATKVDATTLTPTEVQALLDRQDREAVLYADGVIRQTQGSNQPEDVSRLERGTGFLRLFTQFAGYFNMQANTNASSIAKLAAQGGLPRNAGRAFYVLMAGLLLPIWIAEAIAIAFRGGAADEDHDGEVWDDWLRSIFGLGTFRGLVAMVPLAGPVVAAAVNKVATATPADDKISASPVFSALEAAAGVAVAVPYKAATGEFEELNKRQLVRDLAMAIGIATGLPATALARPLGYGAGVAEGHIEPTSPADAVRGLVTGTASPDSKQR